MDGHIHALAFFGAVPQSVLYDNDQCLVAKILPDGTRKRASLFSGFLSHYLIRNRYGRPGKGNDKGNAEDLVVLIGIRQILPAFVVPPTVGQWPRKTAPGNGFPRPATTPRAGLAR